MVPELRFETTLARPPDQVFQRFLDTGSWWPRDYTFTGHTLARAHIEPWVGGQWFEVDTLGKRTDWGEVRVFEPGARLVLAWGVSPDSRPEAPERSSEVEVVFHPAGIGTRVEVIHRDFDRHGPGAADYRAEMAMPEGWPFILAQFAEKAFD